MNLDYSTLDMQRRQHPAWRLLAADSAPLVASFLHRVFVVPNVRVMAQSNLVEALEDSLYGLREQLGESKGSKAFPKSAQEYLNDWAANDKGWLRKFYPAGSDEPHFDLTPPTERALAWLGSLSDRSFVGTESRLLTLFGLLKQMSDGSETNPQARMAELHKQRDAIDAEIARVVEGNMALLDDTALKDRFQQFTGLARELLADFREVEHNFRALDRTVRERIALWDGAKGRRLRLTGPSSTELTERFDDVRAWMKALGCNVPQSEAPRYRIVMREFRHRVLGSNAVPDEVWLDTPDDMLALIGKQKEVRRFASLVQLTRAQHPVLLAWLEKRPLSALALADAWPRLLNVVTWLQAHPRPGIYLRQVDLPGVDSKFIEANRGVLAELLDLALPPQAIDANSNGASQFCRRFGFKDKPLRIRFRLLDASLSVIQQPSQSLPQGLLPAGADQDITLTQADFARLQLPVSRVFITENEVNFLAFPPLPDSLVIFGAGYGFEVLAGARWLHGCRLYYWGDIDTHGFAILDQLRAQFPQVNSVLMDRATLLAHQSQWGTEPQPVQHDLPRLNAAEAALFNDLRGKRLQANLPTAKAPETNVRLEQERIGFDWVKAALGALPSAPSATSFLATESEQI